MFQILQSLQASDRWTVKYDMGYHVNIVPTIIQELTSLGYIVQEYNVDNCCQHQDCDDLECYAQNKSTDCGAHRHFQVSGDLCTLCCHLVTLVVSCIPDV